MKIESEPSDFFRRLDRNRDGELSRAEWAAYYDRHNHPPGDLCMRRDFEPADCDQNGRLTWSEYYDRRFTYSRRCPGDEARRPTPPPTRIAILPGTDRWERA